MSQVELHICRPGHAERKLVLGPGVAQIGRADDNDVVLADVGVSRRHARLEVSDRAVVIEDAGSGNGVWFQGRLVHRQVLGHGEEVVIDPFTLRVSLRAGAQAAPEITDGRDSTAPIPTPTVSASLVVISAHRMPVREFPAWIALVLAVDAFMDMGRTATNVIGNSIACAVIAKWEGLLANPDRDPPVVEQVLGPGEDAAAPATKR